MQVWRPFWDVMTDFHFNMVVRSSMFLVCKGEVNHEGNCTEHHLVRLLLKIVITWTLRLKARRSAWSRAAHIGGVSSQLLSAHVKTRRRDHKTQYETLQLFNIALSWCWRTRKRPSFFLKNWQNQSRRGQAVVTVELLVLVKLWRHWSLHFQ